MMDSSVKRFNIKKYEHAKYLLLIPLYMLVFLLDEKYIVRNYFVSYLPLDDMIPFCEWFVIPYFLWYPLMIGAGVYLFFMDPDGFKKYMTYVGCGFLLIVLLYAVFPNGQNLRPRTFENSNFLTDIIKWVYKNDTNTNVCPSLHVVGTMGAMFALMECEKLRTWWFQTFNVILSFFICISTVFIKQHSILDVFVGIIFGIVYYLIVYKWMPEKSHIAEKQGSTY